MSEMIRIFLADDHPVVRDGLVAILRTQPDFEVGVQAGNGRSAIEQIADTNPDVVLLEIE
ncbi:MAG: response regulator, partial [Anaerolineales bacterium]|nr:response regulator [Anaerolineales bacterium]